MQLEEESSNSWIITFPEMSNISRSFSPDIHFCACFFFFIFLDFHIQMNSLITHTHEHLMTSVVNLRPVMALWDWSDTEWTPKRTGDSQGLNNRRQYKACRNK